MNHGKKSVIRKIVLTTGIVIAALFVLLVKLSVYEVNKSSRETAGNDLAQIAQTYAKYITSWIDENINHMEFYTNADAVYNYNSSEEISQFL